jgi:hypothetical protein
MRADRGSADASSQVAYTRVRTVWLQGAPLDPGRGREWWAHLVAHFEFTRIKIEPIIFKNKIEELCILDAFPAINGLN